VWFYTADAHLGRYQNGKMETLNLNFPTPPICRMIAEKSGALWVGEYAVGEPWGQMFSISPKILIRRPFIDQSIRAEKFDFILAGNAAERGG
jgi:hypothetical protein